MELGEPTQSLVSAEEGNEELRFLSVMIKYIVARDSGDEGDEAELAALALEDAGLLQEVHMHEGGARVGDDTLRSLVHAAGDGWRFVSSGTFRGQEFVAAKAWAPRPGQCDCSSVVPATHAVVVCVRVATLTEKTAAAWHRAVSGVRARTSDVVGHAACNMCITPCGGSWDVSRVNGGLHTVLIADTIEHTVSVDHTLVAEPLTCMARCPRVHTCLPLVLFNRAEFDLGHLSYALLSVYQAETNTLMHPRRTGALCTCCCRWHSNLRGHAGFYLDHTTRIARIALPDVDVDADPELAPACCAPATYFME